MEYENKKAAWWKPAIEVFGRVSVWVVVPIVGALIAGKMLDAHYGTRPWIFLGLSGIGFLVSSFGIVYIVTRYMRDIAKENNDQQSNK